MNEIKKHFNEIAPDYDTWKKKNWYYYQSLKQLVRKYIPRGSAVLEIGTATGDILASLDPRLGIGVDISQAMIDQASKKYGQNPNLHFHCVLISDLPKDSAYDFIIMIDVIEHLEDVTSMVSEIRIKADPQTKVLISMANPLWEPILLALEKLGLKMPEGKHHRISAASLVSIFSTHDFELEKHEYLLPLPVYIPFCSNWINKIIPKIPVLNRLCLVEVFIFAMKEYK